MIAFQYTTLENKKIRFHSQEEKLYKYLEKSFRKKSMEIKKKTFKFY